jgi:hypothetical protein
MGSNKRRTMSITGIFVALETVLMYYFAGLLISGYRPGFILYGGWKTILPQDVVAVNPLRNLLGLTYIVKALFPLYWEVDVEHVGILPPIPPNISIELHNQVLGSTIFLLVFWAILLIAAIVLALGYSRRLKIILQSPPRTYSSSL